MRVLAKSEVWAFEMTTRMFLHRVLVEFMDINSRELLKELEDFANINKRVSNSHSKNTK